jgi:hypothetical protein
MVTACSAGLGLALPGWRLGKDGVVDDDLTRLGSREFEHLTQALVVKVFGALVGVFGDGPDGIGRRPTAVGRFCVGGWRGRSLGTGTTRCRPIPAAPIAGGTPSRA